MNRFSWLLQRLAQLVPVLIGISVISFALSSVTARLTSARAVRQVRYLWVMDELETGIFAQGHAHYHVLACQLGVGALLLSPFGTTLKTSANRSPRP